MNAVYWDYSGILMSYPYSYFNLSSYYRSVNCTDTWLIQQCEYCEHLSESSGHNKLREILNTVPIDYLKERQWMTICWEREKFDYCFYVPRLDDCLTLTFQSTSHTSPLLRSTESTWRTLRMVPGSRTVVCCSTPPGTSSQRTHFCR